MDKDFGKKRNKKNKRNNKKRHHKKQKYVQVSEEQSKPKFKLSPYFEQNTSFIPDLDELLGVLTLPQNSKIIKIAKTVYSRLDTIVYDIKLHRHKEDDLYFGHQWFIRNIRRGFSVASPFKKVIKRGAPFYEPGQFRMLRKGLPKFFDLDITELGYKQTIRAKTSVLGHFQNSKQSLPLELFVCEKSNGENFQASFDPVLGRFVICSKNVSFLVGGPQDVDSFDGISKWDQNQGTETDASDYFFRQRFSFARLMAKAFFRKLQKLSPERLAQLKELMSKLTMVGEYCGNPEFQHLVMYDRIDLQVFAFVDKASDRACIPLPESMQIARDFGFTHVEIHRETVNSLEKLRDALDRAYTDCFFNKHKRDSEGAVLYVADRSGQVTHLVKLKTMDYRMKRKLREKIRNTLPSEKKKKTTPLAKAIKKYKSELKSMCKDYEQEMAREIAYYLQLGEYLLPLSQRLFDENIRVTDRYVDFLVATKPFFEMRFQGLEFEQDLAFKLICAAFKNEALMQRLRALYSNKLLDEDALEQIKMRLQKTRQETTLAGSNLKLLTIIPIGIVGSGKTFIMETVVRRFAEQNGFWGGSVSSDEQAKKTMIRLKTDPNTKKVSEDDPMELVFQKSFNERRNDFKEATQEVFRNAESSLQKRPKGPHDEPQLALKKVKKSTEQPDEGESGSEDSVLEAKPGPLANEGEDSSADEDDKSGPFARKRIIFIDKNHPLNASFHHHLRDYQVLGKKSDVVMVGLVPGRIEEYDLSKWHYFDDKTLFICLHNVLSRSGHPTTDLAPEKRLNIFLLFLSFFKRSTQLNGIMKNYVVYRMDFDVYHKKHASEVNLPGNEQPRQADFFDAKFSKQEFQRSTELLQKLHKFKQHKDKTGKIKIPGKKIDMVQAFTDTLKAQDEYKELVRLVQGSAIDYESKAAPFAQRLEADLEAICKKPDRHLKHWAQELKMFPLYLGLDCDIQKKELNSLIFETVKAIGKANKGFAKAFNVLKMNNKKSVEMSIMSHPQTMHCTLKFFRQYLSEENKIIEQFREREGVALNVSHFIFARNVILTLIVDRDENFDEGLARIRSPVQNKVQHVTYAKASGIRPYESNMILDQIHERLEEEEIDYKAVDKVKEFESIVLSSKHKATVYLVKLSRPVQIEATSRKYFK